MPVLPAMGEGKASRVAEPVERPTHDLRHEAGASKVRLMRSSTTTSLALI